MNNQEGDDSPLILNFPSEIIALILSTLGVKEVGYFGRVCKCLTKPMNDQLFWKNRASLDFVYDLRGM
jgi:hypothetical protein